MRRSRFHRNLRFNLDQQPVQGVLPQAATILTWKNIYPAFIISISFHSLVLLMALFFHSSTDHIVSQEFAFFFLSDTILWISCLIPLVAIFRRKIQWHDPYFILAGFIFGTIMMIYLGYVVDPEYAYERYHWGTFSFRDFPPRLLLIRFVESEFVILIFVSILVYTNRYSFKEFSRPKVHRDQVISASLTGILCAILGIIGFKVQWSSGDFLNALILEMGLQVVAVPPGTGKYVAFQKWAIMTIPFLVVGFIYLAPRRRFFRFLRDLLLILVIISSVLPAVVYGARALVIYMVYSSLVIINKFAIRIRWVHGLFVIVLIFLLVLFITLVRANPTLSGPPGEILKSFLTGHVVNIRNPRIEASSFLFQADRVGSIASILQHLRITGEYQYGKSLLSGPINLLVYFFNKITNHNLDKMLTSTDHTFIWNYGTLELEYFYGKRPPSLPGEFFIQFGYIAIVPLSIVFGLFFNWLRKKQMTSNSLIKYWVYTIISVELLNSVGAEFGLIFKFFVFHIIPIITIYIGIYFLLYGWRKKKLASSRNNYSF